MTSGLQARRIFGWTRHLWPRNRHQLSRQWLVLNETWSTHYTGDTYIGNHQSELADFSFQRRVEARRLNTDDFH